VARDRQRAKQRKARRARNPGPAPSQPRRENVPGELEHASGEVDEFEAALISSRPPADGEPDTAEPEAAEPEAAEPEAAEPDAAEPEAAEPEAAEPDVAAGVEPAPDAEPVLDPDEGEGYPQALSDEDFDELEDEIDERVEEDEEPEAEDDRGRRRAATGVAATGAAPTPARRPPAAPGQVTQKGAGRFAAFLRASWAELQRVQWPNRRQVGQATAVVLGFVVIAGAYLGLADRVASEIVDLII
jgi:preprotein translocase subunit SecE